MFDYLQHESVHIELEPYLLSTPYDAQTNWHVITGATCSGKTTLIEMLAQRGFRTVPEAGRQIIAQEAAKGRKIADIREDEAVNRAICGLQLTVEAKLSAQEIAFLDRGFPDVLAFIRLVGMDPNEFLPFCFRHRYASVLLLERLPAKGDELRIEDDAASAFLEGRIARDYAALGYDVVRVPVMSPQERLAFVLETLGLGEEAQTGPVSAADVGAGAS